LHVSDENRREYSPIALDKSMVSSTSVFKLLKNGCNVHDASLCLRDGR